MNRKVFFSYSWKDMKVAMRLYDDLTRSHLEVWRDQIDGDPTADFLEEFLKKIDESDDFIILDSPNYRTKSNWCLTEIERCFINRAKRNAPRIIVCLLEKDGNWRKVFRSEKHKILFSQINMFKYHELFYDGKYDNENIYQQSISAICALFSERYIPWNSLPSNRDLLEELATSSRQITDKDRTMLLNGYEYIVHLINQQRDVNNHFQLWISDCDFYSLNLFFPRWTYCVWLGHDMHQGRYSEKCYDEFKKLSEDFPNDPRCFRGLGCIAARLEKNQIAINAFQKALRLMECHENLWHKEHSQMEVFINIGQVFLNTGQIETAIGYLYNALAIMRLKSGLEIQSVLSLIYCLVATGRFLECKDLLLKLIKEHPLENELYTELGKIYSQEEDNKNAIKCFEHAYSLAPSIQNAFYLLCRKSQIHDIKKESEIILDREVSCLDDYYWKGAICFYLIQNEKMAKYYFNKSSGMYDWYQ